MRQRTKKDILFRLKCAQYLFERSIDRTMDESHALDELNELIAHIKDWEVEHVEATHS